MSIGAGTTDFLNSSLSINDHNGTNYLEWAETGAFGGGLGSLWQNKLSWLDQTSVLHADQISSPLLLFHCTKDGVPAEQAVQMFTALWRLEKKIWWLQYDYGDHRLGLPDTKDFTIRYMQFYDHYLKALVPRWMTEGIPGS